MKLINRSYELCCIAFGEDVSMALSLDIASQVNGYLCENPYLKVLANCDYNKNVEIYIDKPGPIIINLNLRDYVPQAGLLTPAYPRGTPWTVFVSISFGMVCQVMGLVPYINDYYCNPSYTPEFKIWFSDRDPARLVSGDIKYLRNLGGQQWGT